MQSAQDLQRPRPNYANDKWVFRMDRNKEHMYGNLIKKYLNLALEYMMT